MRKFLTALGVAALLSWPFFPAQAAVVTNTTDQLFNAVGETSTSLTVPGGTELTVFISGTYAAGNIVVLQEEAGSPGSGVFRTVKTLTNGTADARITTGFKSGPNKHAYRMLMTATGTGDVVAYLTDRSRVPVNYVNDADQQVYFNDFDTTEDVSTSATVVSASFFVTETQSTSGGTIGAVTLAVQEGGLTIISGDGSSGLTDEATCVGQVVLANWASLVSDGWHAFEVRLQSDSLSGLVTSGLVDVICVADNIPLADIDSGVVVANGATAAIASIHQQDEATNSNNWQAVSAISNAEGANALEVPGPTAVAATYEVLIVEIDSLGNAYFYVNGLMFHAEPLAVLTTSRIIPFVQNSGTAGGTTAITTKIDYWKWTRPRPAS